MRKFLEEPVAILSAVRTPIGRFGGSIAKHSAVELGTIAIREAVARAGISPSAVKEVVMGNVASAGTGQGPAKQAAMLAGLDPRAAARTVNSVCGSGLAAICECVNSIVLGVSDICIAGGMESASQSPYMIGAYKKTGERVTCKLAGFRPIFAEPDFERKMKSGEVQVKEATRYDGLFWPPEKVFMRDYACAFAKRMGYTVQAINEAAEGSYLKAEQATELGWFAKEITPVDGISRDDIADKEARQKLLEKAPDDPASGYNSSSPSDGAAALVLASIEAAEALGVTPMGYINAYSFVGCAPAEFLSAPIDAVKEIRDAGTKSTIIEVNEAFGMQLLLFREAFAEMDVNPQGGAVALGHPLGVSGARIIVTLLHEMERRGDEKGLAAICFGGSGAYAAAISRRL